MLFEEIQKAHVILTMVSPLLCLFLIVAGLRVDRAKSVVRILVGIVVGLIGCTAFQPAAANAWGWDVLAWVFLFPWWFVLGYMVVWLMSALFVEPRQRKLAAVLLIPIVLFLTSLVLFEGYARNTERDVYQSVRDYLKGNLDQSVITQTGIDNTEIFKNEVNQFLNYYPDKLTESQVVFLAGQGFNIYQCPACPRRLIDKALAFEGGAVAGRGLPPFSLASLAANPAITDDDFLKLAAVGEDGIFQALIVNPSMTEERYQILRPILEQAIKIHSAANDAENRMRAQLVERLKHLDEERERRLRKARERMDGSQ